MITVAGMYTSIHVETFLLKNCRLYLAERLPFGSGTTFSRQELIAFAHQREKEKGERCLPILSVCENQVDPGCDSDLHCLGSNHLQQKGA